MFVRLDRLINRFAVGLALLGGAGLLLSMAVTLISIVGKNIRRILDSGNAWLGNSIDAQNWSGIHSILGEEEFVGLAIGFALFCALPLAQLSRIHIRVDLLESRLPEWANRLVDVLADFGFTAIFALIIWFQWTRVVKKTRAEASGFWDHLLNNDWGGAASRFKPGNTQILDLPKAYLILTAEALLIFALIVSIYCTLRSINVLLQPNAARLISHD